MYQVHQHMYQNYYPYLYTCAVLVQHIHYRNCQIRYHQCKVQNPLDLLLFKDQLFQTLKSIHLFRNRLLLYLQRGRCAIRNRNLRMCLSLKRCIRLKQMDDLYGLYNLFQQHRQIYRTFKKIIKMMCNSCKSIHCFQLIF